MLRLIEFYRRWISPLLPPRCRFVPSCSSYAIEAIESHGTVRGSWLAAKRVCRCHPFHPGGFDPVPLTIHPTAPGGAKCGMHAKALKTTEPTDPTKS